MDKVAIITGGGSGLGYHITRELLKKGMETYIIGRNFKKLQAAQKILCQYKENKVKIFCGDISDELFVRRVFCDLYNENKEVELLINNAGEGVFGPIEDINKDMISTALAGSLIGTILMSAEAIKYMKKGGGTIVNIMSTAALKGKAEAPLYCAAKWGARGFTESIKCATIGTNIRVVGVYPGGMLTDFWDRHYAKRPDGIEMMSPEEVAQEIVHAISGKESIYVSELVIRRRNVKKRGKTN